MARHKLFISAALALACVAAGLATSASASGKKDKDKTPDPRIGDKADRICFQRNIHNFRTLKGVDDAVLLETNVNDWYYVELLGACNSHDLQFAQSVAIKSRPAGGCVSRGDDLIFSDSINFRHRDSTQNIRSCVITGIYKWNPDAGKDNKDGAKNGAKDDAKDDAGS